MFIHENKIKSRPAPFLFFMRAIKYTVPLFPVFFAISILLFILPADVRASLSDFEVTASDIVFDSPVPVPGEVFTTSATVRNIGGFGTSITTVTIGAYNASYTNGMPFAGLDYNSARAQMLYLAETIAKSGRVTGFQLQKLDAADSNYGTTSFEVYMCHRNAANDTLGTDFPGNCNMGDRTRVWNTQNVPFSGNQYDWVNFNVDDIFRYDGTNNLIVEIIWVGDSANLVTAVGIQSGIGAQYCYVLGGTGDTGTVDTTNNTRIPIQLDLSTQTVNVKFFNGDSESSQIGTTKTLDVVGGSVDTVSVDWSAGTAGDYNIYVYVDTPTLISESLETNNKAYKTILITPDVTAPGKITDLTVTCPADYTAYLQWTSPGDNDYSYTLKSPSKYKIQYSISNTISWSTTSAQITIDASNTNPYDWKSYTEENLSGAATYYFRIWTADEIPNWSIISDSKKVYVTGVVAPAAVADLSAQTGCCCTNVDLSWTAPGDDENTGTASEYFVKYATYTITFNSHTDTSDTDFNAGTRSSTTVSGTGDSAYVKLSTGAYLGPLTGGNTPVLTGNGVGNDLTRIITNAGANITASGRITQWQMAGWVGSGGATQVALRIYRDGGTNWIYVGGSAIETIPSPDTISTFNTDISVQQGDVIGIRTTNLTYVDNVAGAAGDCYYIAGDKTSDSLKTAWTSQAYNIKLEVSGDDLSGYLSSGTWTSGTSPVLAANTTAAWEINWSSTTPTGTSVSAATRTGDTASPDATWSGWSSEITDSGRQGVLSPDAKYIQYRAILRTYDATVTPNLNDLTLNYTTWWASVNDATGEPSPQEAGTPQNMTLSLYPKTTYYFAIRTKDDENNLSGVDTNTWTSVTQSSAMAYYLCPPTSPKILSVYESSITMQWDLVTYPFEDGYVLEASTASDFTGTLHSSVTARVDLSALTVMEPALDTNTTYYLGAGALYGNTTAYSETLSTSTLANPILNSQFYGVYETSVTVIWDAFPGTPLSSTCEGYILQASINSDFVPIWRSSSTKSIYLNYLTMPTLFSETTYYFRVGALNWNNVANHVYVGSTFTHSGTGDGTGTAAFKVAAEEINDTSIVEELTFYGNGQSTITAVAFQIPYTWSWTGLAGDIALSGGGFTNPDPDHPDPDDAPEIVVEGAGTASNPYIISIGVSTPTFITEIKTATITISGLTPPGQAGTAATNAFTVWTRGKQLLTIVDFPGIKVYGKLYLETDTVWNPSGAIVKEGSAEYMVAAFTLDTEGEDVAINELTVKFTAVGGATLGGELISFRIYKESNATADGWDPVTDLWLTAGVAQAIAGTFEKYIPDQNKILTQADGNHTYYLTVNFSAAPPLALYEGVKADIAVSTISVTGAVSGYAFTNKGSFAGNNCYMGGAAAASDEADVLRLGMDRHTFYDGGNYWMFYLVKNGNMADVYFKTSPDGGDWSGDAVKLNVAVSTFSSLGIWQDSTDVFVSYSDGNDTYIRTVQISDKSLGPTEYAITSAADNHSQIIIDSAGILWRKGEER